MEFVTNIIAAEDEESSFVGESSCPLDEWSGIDAPGPDTPKLAVLHSVLTGDLLQSSLDLYEPVYVSENGTAVLRIADELFEKLITEGQAPETLIIACSDSRIDPAILTNAEPGELFSVRNVAALVPAYDADGHAHGTSAAIDYAVGVLKVKNIIVLGHALCGGMTLEMQAEIGPGLDGPGLIVLYEFGDDAVFDEPIAIVGLAQRAARIAKGVRDDDLDGLDGG